MDQPEDQVALILETGLDEIYQAMKREEKVTLVNIDMLSMCAAAVRPLSSTLLKNGVPSLAAHPLTGVN